MPNPTTVEDVVDWYYRKLEQAIMQNASRRDVLREALQSQAEEFEKEKQDIYETLDAEYQLQLKNKADKHEREKREIFNQIHDVVLDAENLMFIEKLAEKYGVDTQSQTGS
jgi:hypothetical protein